MNSSLWYPSEIALGDPERESNWFETGHTGQDWNPQLLTKISILGQLNHIPCSGELARYSGDLIFTLPIQSSWVCKSHVERRLKLTYESKDFFPNTNLQVSQARCTQLMFRTTQQQKITTEVGSSQCVCAHCFKAVIKILSIGKLVLLKNCFTCLEIGMANTWI